MGGAYYNEIDKCAAETLRQLIKAGHIAAGDVDERSIIDVRADDLKGYTQVHFFAGIGIWSAALRLARWADDRPVWTGSCPCQDYSVAGKQQGNEGERNLWPYMFGLVRERHPVALLGEQVENAVGFGWLDGVCADLEAEAYATGAVVLGAHSIGSPNIRQRLYWMGHTKSGQSNGREPRDMAEAQGQGRRVNNAADYSSADGGMANMQRTGPQRSAAKQNHAARNKGAVRRDGDVLLDLWRESQWHECRDGKRRRIPIEPRLFPLADAGANKGYRVAALRGAGNAINLGTAAAFIEAAKGEIDP